MPDRLWREACRPAAVGTVWVPTGPFHREGGGLGRVLDKPAMTEMGSCHRVLLFAATAVALVAARSRLARLPAAAPVQKASVAGGPSRRSPSRWTPRRPIRGHSRTPPRPPAWSRRADAIRRSRISWSRRHATSRRAATKTPWSALARPPGRTGAAWRPTTSAAPRSPSWATSRRRARPSRGRWR